MALSMRKGTGQAGGGRGSTVQYEILLQEMLTKAGCDLSPGAPPDVRRLACHMQLLQELHRSGAFGALTGVMSMVVTELNRSLYTNEVIADPLLGATASAGPQLARLPFFAVLDRIHAELDGARAMTDHMHEREKAYQKVEQQTTLSMQETQKEMEELHRVITQLEYEVAKAQETASSALEELEVSRAKDRAAIQYLEHNLSLAKDAAFEAMEENKMMRAREEVEANMRAHFSPQEPESQPPDEDGTNPKEILAVAEADTLIRQLLVLQIGRVQDFENRMANAVSPTIPSTQTVDKVRSFFAGEMTALHAEIAKLREHKENLRKIHKMQSAKTIKDLREERAQRFAEAPDPSNSETIESSSCSTLVYSSAKQERLWHMFHVLVNNDNHLADPEVPYLCSPADLLRIIDRALEENFLVITPYVTCQSEGMMGYARRMFKLDREFVDSKVDPVEVAASCYQPANRFFFQHLQRRYGCHEVTLLMAHATLKAVETTQASSSKVLMFGKIISGDLEDAAWQYALQIQRLLHNHPKHDWQVNSRERFEEFWRLLYPQLSDSEVAGQAKEVVKAQRKASLTNEVVVKHVITTILNKTEPRLKRWIKVLKWKDTLNTNTVYRNDVVASAPKTFPDIDPKIADYAFCISAAKYGGDNIPLETMAYTACHLEALSLAWPPL